MMYPPSAPSSYFCSFCNRYEQISDEWSHGFGWSKCPTCTAKPDKAQKRSVAADFISGLTEYADSLEAKKS